MKKKIVAVGILALLLIALLVGPNLASAAGGAGWSWWWIDGPKVASYSSTFLVEEPLVVRPISMPFPGEIWFPNQIKTWKVELENTADIDLPAALYIGTEGSSLGRDAKYIVTLTPTDPDPTDDIMPEIKTWTKDGLASFPRFDLGLLSGVSTATVSVEITSSNTMSPGTLIINIQFYRGEVVEESSSGMG